MLTSNEEAHHEDQPGIWAPGLLVTGFVPGGYKSEFAAERMIRAVEADRPLSAQEASLPMGPSSGDGDDGHYPLGPFVSSVMQASRIEI